MNYRDGVMLGDLIDYLEAMPQDVMVRKGFGEPSSYRGYYEHVAFEPVEWSTIGQMHEFAVSALGRTFRGYKGGEFTMQSNTFCFIAEYGECAELDQIINVTVGNWALQCLKPTPNPTGDNA